MNKSFRILNQNGNEMSKAELNRLCEEMNLFHRPIEPVDISPPGTVCEFESRLIKLLEHYFENYFGLTHYLDFDERKTLEKNPSIESLVDVAIKIEKRGPPLINTQLNGYSFLKLALERNFPFSAHAQASLGLRLDRTDLTKPKRHGIAVQSAAQVLWYIEKSQLPTIEAMEKRLLDKKHPFFDLLGLKDFQSSRTIENWVRFVYPVPVDQRKKRRSKDPSVYDRIITIPDIYTEKGTNFLRLRFALIFITRVMKVMNCSLEEVLKSGPIAQLVEPLRFYPKRYALEWIQEAYSTNGSLYQS